MFNDDQQYPGRLVWRPQSPSECARLEEEGYVWDSVACGYVLPIPSRGPADDCFPDAPDESSRPSAW
jgi:hypothetical protein